ncbi:MAG: prolyl oligopeptidase family serine peptidase [Muribaculaceae bacterium]|nr:prolyl oligopeptidase family serine peptidase [Muribaculaceae bacterium]
MKKSFISTYTAVAALSAAAVCAFASTTAAPSSNLPEDSTPSSTSGDTIVLSRLAAGDEIVLAIPATPDSIDVKKNPFKMESLLSSLSPLSEFKAAEEIKGLKIVDLSSNALKKREDSTPTIRRYLTSFRPDAFFKGEIIVKTPGMLKGFLNGKEILSKNSFDTIPSASKAKLTLEPGQDALLELHILSEKYMALPEVAIIPDKESVTVSLQQGPELKPIYNIYTILSGERIANVRISPDGNYLLVKATFCQDGVNTDTDYYVLDRRTNRKIVEDLDNDVAWLNNKPSTLLYSESSQKSGLCLKTLEIPSMKNGIMASHLPDDAAGGTLSPDGKYIVYYSKTDGQKDTGITRRLLSPDDRQPGKRDSYYLSLYNFDEKTARTLTFGGPSTYILDISPDSRKILYSSTRETPERFPFYEATVVEMDVNTLKTDTIRGFDASFTEAIYSPDGKQLLIAAGPNAFNGIGLNAGDFDWGNDFDMQLYIAELAKGTLKNIKPATRDFDPSVMGGLIWNPTDRKIYFRAQKGYDAFIYSLNPVSGEIAMLPSEVDFVTSWSVCRNHPDIVGYTGMGYEYMGKAYVLNSRTGKSTLIASPNDPYISRVNFGKSAMWEFECPEDAYSKAAAPGSLPTKVECTYTLPPDFDSSKKYPMIVYYYGGTSPTTHTNHSPYTPNLLASRGYVVLTMNPSGTIGYGQEFSARHVNAWGDRTADEIIYGVRKFCEENPYVDDHKIGCIGASYGGFMTQLLQTKTDLFAAAVSHAGISNIASYWGEGFWGYSYNSVAAARSYPWNNPKLFIENSPLFSADKIHTPLLLLHGNRDTNVPIGESIQLYNALKILGRDVEFITIDGSDHIVIDFQQRKEWHATIMAWFERWLKGDSRWWDEIYGKE